MGSCCKSGVLIMAHLRGPNSEPRLWGFGAVAAPQAPIRKLKGPKRCHEGGGGMEGGSFWWALDFGTF